MPAAMHVHEIEAFAHGFHRKHHVVGIARIRVEGDERAHTADLEIRVDFVALLHDKRGRDKLMMGRLIERLFRVVELRKLNARIGPAENVNGGVRLVVDFVERHPVFDFVLIALHDGFGVADKEVN